MNKKTADLYNVRSWDAGRGIKATRNNITGTIYEKGNAVAWQCKRGWAVAQLIDHHYRNHQYHMEESDALDDLVERVNP